MSDMVLFQLFYATCILKSTLFDYVRRTVFLRRG